MNAATTSVTEPGGPSSARWPASSFPAASSLNLAWPATSRGAGSHEWRVGVIGHTGRGGYGHELDTVWLEVPGVEIVGVADANATGLAEAMQRLHIKSGFADYHKMVTATKPDIVAVYPRQPDQHCDMILAAIEAGARGIYVEKPFCRTPAEADEIVMAISQRRRCRKAFGCDLAWLGGRRSACRPPSWRQASQSDYCHPWEQSAD